MIDFLNCPNCGAPITSDHCEYCGSVFYDWAVMDTEKPFFLKIKYRDRYVWIKAAMDSIQTETEQEQTYYADNRICRVVNSSPCLNIQANFHTVPFDGPYGEMTWAVLKKGLK